LRLKGERMAPAFVVAEVKAGKMPALHGFQAEILTDPYSY